MPMDDIVTRLEAADIAVVLKMLPHRYPFLMVDRLIDIRGDEHGIGIKNVTINEPHFLGHFPEHPVMPGVLLIEGMAQTAGALCVLSQTAPARPKLVYFMTIDNAKFRKPVNPGDRLDLEISLIHRRGDLFRIRGEIKVGEHRVAEARILLSVSHLRPPETAAPTRPASPSAPATADSRRTHAMSQHHRSRPCARCRA